MLLSALPEPHLIASLVAHAGYILTAGAALLAAGAVCGAVVLLGRKRIAWDTLLDIPVAVASEYASVPVGGRTCELVLEEARTDGTQDGRLVMVGITNPGLTVVRGGDFSSPLTFAFADREIRAARLVPEPGSRMSARASWAPVVDVPAQGGGGATRVQLTGDFRLLPGDSYSLLLVLAGTPAARSGVIWHEGSLIHGNIIPLAEREPAGS